MKEDCLNRPPMIWIGRTYKVQIPEQVQSLSPSEVIAKDREFVIHGWGYSPVVLVYGKGAIVRDINGKEYIDCISQTAGPVGIGHNHPRYLDAVKKQLDTISHTL